jgi:SAM-dependent methyltransferase
VLEHVQEPKKVISEVYRLLKPNGKFFFSTVNYFSFYEGHYRIPWIPGLNKEIAPVWVKLFRRNPRFLNEINFITLREILIYLRDIGFKNIKVGYDYPSVSLPHLAVNYPEGFSAPTIKIRRSALQIYIQHPRIHKLLGKLNMEYKIYIEATK